MQELRKAAYDGDLQTVINLHKKQKHRVNEVGPNSQKTALHWAAFRGHEQIVSYLLKAGKAQVKVDLLDNDQNTALNLVIQATNLPLTKKMSIITMLLASGADPLMKNAEGKTPLMSLVPLRSQIVSIYPHLRNGMNNIIQKIKMSIYDKARELNRTVSIYPDGEVILDKTAVPLQDPRTYAAQTSRLPQLRPSAAPAA